MLKVNDKEVRTHWMSLLLTINSFPVGICLKSTLETTEQYIKSIQG